MLSDILNFLKVQGISKASFCGHSLSGMLFSRYKRPNDLPSLFTRTHTNHLFSRLATRWPDLVETVIMVDIDPCKKPQEPNLVSHIIPVLNVIIETIRSERITDLEQAKKRGDEILAKFITEERVRKDFLGNLVVKGDKIDWMWVNS